MEFIDMMITGDMLDDEFLWTGVGGIWCLTEMVERNGYL